MVERALQFEHQAVQRLLALLALHFGELRCCDLSTARHVQLTARSECEQSADIVEREQREATALLLEQLGDVALCHLGHIDRLERKLRALEQLHAARYARV